MRAELPVRILRVRPWLGAAVLAAIVVAGALLFVAWSAALAVAGILILLIPPIVLARSLGIARGSSLVVAVQTAAFGVSVIGLEGLLLNLLPAGLSLPSWLALGVAIVLLALAIERRSRSGWAGLVPNRRSVEDWVAVLRQWRSPRLRRRIRELRTGDPPTVDHAIPDGDGAASASATTPVLGADEAIETVRRAAGRIDRWIGASRAELAMLGGAVVIIGLAIVIARVGVTGPAEQYTELWIDPAPAAGVTAEIAVRNDEGRPVTYKIVLLVSGRVTSVWPSFEVASGATWTGDVSQAVPNGGELQVLLYRESDPNVYRQVAIWGTPYTATGH